MTMFFAEGSSETVISDDALRSIVRQTFERLGQKERVLVVPPDYTRYHSRSGVITRHLFEFYGSALADVLPALGTHHPMTPEQISDMYAGVPRELFREHRWRDDVVTIGEVDAEFVAQATDGIWTRPWPAQMNRMVWEGGHDLVVSVGQVVPHEVMGMANYNKNIFVGTGGHEGINESHFIGAAYGMERMMGRADTPLRRILNEAEHRFCSELPLVYVLTVVGPGERGELVTRGVFIGDDPECFERAAELSVAVNFNQLPTSLDKVVVYLPPDEFQSTWLGNKSIYRTRMAIADGGELIVLAPGVKAFGEDAEIDGLIRKYGYRTTPEVMSCVDEQEDLQRNLSAAAHLIHGSTENRFSVTYCPGGLSREEVEGVGYQYGELTDYAKRFDITQLSNGWNELPDEGRFYFIDNPALGLWASQAKLNS